MKCGIAFDIDGVLVKGKRVLDQGVRAIRRVKEAQVPFILLTNGGGVTEEAKAKELSFKLQSEIKPSQMILAHTPMAPLAKKYNRDDSDAVLIIGKDSCRDVALSYGIKHPVLTNEIFAACPDVWPHANDILKPSNAPSELDLNRKIGAIMSFHDSKNWGLDIQIVCDLLRANGDLRRIFAPEHHSHRKQHHVAHQIPVYFSNGDFVWSNNLPLTRFAQGSFRDALETVYLKLSGRKLEYTMYGKPQTLTYDFAKKAIDAHAAEIHGPKVLSEPRIYFGVGDNPESDIAGANAAGWTSLLVKTGVYEGGKHDASILVEDVEEAVDVILRR